MASMDEYLKRYTGEGGGSGDDKEKKKKKKKKRKEAGKVVTGGVKIFDDDAKWQKEIKEESEEDEADGGPQVEADMEVRRMQRLEEIKAHRPYLSIGEDGSGWVTIGDEEDDKGGKDKGGKDKGVGRNQQNDLSPPRRARHDSPDLSPPRKVKNDSADLSPPRRARARHDFPDEPSALPRPRHGSPDLSPPRKTRVDSDRKAATDLSPPRRAGRDLPDSPEMPRAKVVQNDGTDLSLPRKGRQDSSDLSPPRRTRHDSPDLSPPRRRDRNEAPDLSPPRKRRHDSPDLSPPRRAGNGSADLSPPRRARHDSPTLSPSRKRKTDPGAHGMRQGEDDLSPPRKSRQDKNGDLSPPRKRSHTSHALEGALIGDQKKGARLERMTDGTLAGLRTGREVMAELEQKRREDAARFAQLDASITGRGAQTVYRDKQGKKSNMEQIMEESMAAKKKELPPPVWGKGLAQSREAAKAAQALAAAASQPFAQYESDPSRDRQLRDAIRWGDPMAHLVKAKLPEVQLQDFSANPALLESGFKIPQEVPPHSWLKRGIGPPPNRFGIRPGRHWDGVDRSTGFEKESFKMKNEKAAQEKEAYMWSVADM